MITSILKFELKRRFTGWMALLILGIMIFQGVWYTKGNFDYYVNEDLLINSAAIFYKNLAGCGMLMVIIVAVITGSVLFKDIEHKTGQWVYTLPVNDKKFFLGKFISAYTINVLFASGYLIGMLLVPYSGIGESNRFGPTPLGPMLHGFLVFLMPNLLLLSVIIFAALTFFKKMAAGYLGVLVTVVSFLVMQTSAESAGASPLMMLVDPFGYVASDYTISLLTSIEKNQGVLHVSGYLLLNRVIWFSFSLFLLFISYRKFSFKDFILSSKKKKDTAVPDAPISTVRLENQLIPSLSFTGVGYMKKLVSLASLEFKNIVRPAAFKVILGVILLMAVLQNLLWSSVYIGSVVPLTSSMTLFRLAFGVFIIMLIMVWSGELFFKDRTVKIWQITGALPVPVWVTQLSRFIAMVGVSFVFAASFMLLGVLSQLVMGGASLIDIPLYLYDLMGYNWGWLTYILQIALVFFVAGLTGNRFLTHILSIGSFFLMIMAYELGLAEQVIYAYSAVPGLEDYSEVAGYGIWKTSAPWYFLMWALLACVFVFLGILFWDRGVATSWYRKLTFRGRQLSWVGKSAALVLLAGFFWVRATIVSEVNGKGNFALAVEEELDAVNYETQYAHLQTLPQPKYAHVDLNFDYYPDVRKAAYVANIELINTTAESIDSLYLNYASFVQVISTSLNDIEITASRIDARHDLYIYALPERLLANDTLDVRIKASKQYIGFTQSGNTPQPDLTYEGSFGSIRDFLPVIGYDDSRELKENRKREDHGLAKLSSRMADIDDQKASGQDLFSPDALWVTGSITIGTSDDQQPIAPGRLAKVWQDDNRNYALYQVENSSPFEWCLGSVVSDAEGQSYHELAYSIVNNPRHAFNKLRYQQAIEQSYDFIGEKLGGFPYQDLRLVEIPYYQDDFYTFPNTIVISEKQGWYADTTALKEQVYIAHTVSSQMFKLWITNKVKIGNVQGAEMLSIALPEALSLLYIENQYGTEAVDLLVKKKRDLYAKNRFNEPNTEPALLYADGGDYLEINKGAVALYHLGKDLGEARLYGLIQKWVRANEDQYVNFKSLYDSLLINLNNDQTEKMRIEFEEVI